MTNKDNLDFFADQLFDNVIRDFQSTKRYGLLKEKLDRMECDCETMLARDEQEFAEECFELLRNVSEQEKQYVYRRGLLDCAAILKHLGVLK